MSAIDITITETVCGTTVSLSFSISPEALMHELQGGLEHGRFSGIPADLFEKLVGEVLQESQTQLASLRSKLRLLLVSSSTKFLKENSLSVSGQGAATD